MAYESLKDRVVLVITTGNEYLGKFEEETEDYIKLKQPKGFIVSPEGQGGIAPGISIAVDYNIESMNFLKTNVITVAPVRNEIENAYYIKSHAHPGDNIELT